MQLYYTVDALSATQLLVVIYCAQILVNVLTSGEVCYIITSLT
jgi:hypothetical protein